MTTKTTINKHSMKNYMLVAVSFALGTLAYGQTLEEALKKTDNERYELAKKEYRALIAKEPAKGDYYFYLGENFRKQGELDSALGAWQQGVKADAVGPLSLVGSGNILWYKGDTAAARKQFISACATTKHKNAEVMRQVGATYTYAPIKNLDAAIKLLNDAIKLDPKNIEGYLILGDALLEKTPSNGSPAIAQYNKALDIDPKNCKGIVRKAKLYQRGRAYEEANGLYKDAQTLDPTYAPAYRENAELNMLFDQHSRAIENWKKYLELNNSDEARYRFATALFSGKKYCEAITELETIQANGFVNLYTRRMLTYSLYECNPESKVELNQKGLEQSDKFFQLAPSDKVIGLDYKYRGLHLSKMAKDSLAIIELEKAMLLDSAKRGELAGDVAKMYLKAKKYDPAIANYQIKWNGNAENLNATEFYELGRAYYFGPKDYKMADSCFKAVSEKAPDFAMAYFWRGRSNLKLDIAPTKYLAKPYYEKFLESLTEEEKVAANQKANQIEASKYLGDYYVNSKEGKDYAKAKIFWKTVQTLEPTDAQAKAFFASPAGK
jgi:Tfp pilus assembly protein PilF